MLTAADILEISRKAIAIFAKYGLRCCLVGSVASYLYGVDRTPNVRIRQHTSPITNDRSLATFAFDLRCQDVDLVVLTTAYGQEDPLLPSYLPCSAAESHSNAIPSLLHHLIPFCHQTLC